MLIIWSSFRKYKKCARMLSHYIWKSSLRFSHYFHIDELLNTSSLVTQRAALGHPHTRGKRLKTPKGLQSWEKWQFVWLEYNNVDAMVIARKFRLWRLLSNDVIKLIKWVNECHASGILHAAPPSRDRLRLSTRNQHLWKSLINLPWRAQTSIHWYNSHTIHELRVRMSSSLT